MIDKKSNVSIGKLGIGPQRFLVFSKIQNPHSGKLHIMHVNSLIF